MKYETLYNMLPVLEEGKMVLGLESMEELMDILDHPENKIPIIHIAGSNGKGSTANFIATILEESGYSVGLFTSPSLVEFNERIQIDRTPISDAFLLDLAQELKSRVDNHHIQFTEFELFTALAYMAFAEKAVDIAIMEVGLGGKLDATNIVQKPVLTVITKIALDHQEILGNTIEEIAGEKAGIIKPGVPLVLYPQAYAGADQVIRQVAEDKGADLYPVSSDDIDYVLTSGLNQDFTYKSKKYRIGLLEEHSIWNAAVAIQALHVLANIGFDKINEESLKNGLMKTRWPARFELIHTDPTIVIDGSHNPDGIFELGKNLNRYFSGKKITAIVGLLADKDIDAALPQVLAMFEQIITVEPNSDRAMSADDLAKKIINYQLNEPDTVTPAQSYESALDHALSMTDRDDLLLIMGSTYYVGLVRKIILERKGNNVNG